ncbi:DUF2971 domain-containing protein [Prosthecobacter sp.]|uniref:DUF2971 domain-containing protein n=1 Tax=Prosthecobacter sp. TaxID=1965333 RepID=UPI001DAADF69|nr:DUF2971 domain-containing protein [Prosthecobacter sp.]MCB1276765.1 DUF2971 domain-containing protein [Prosthecobacter sp.]
MRLFRYFDAIGALATLTNKTMRFASPLKFNDPFEMTPRIEQPPEELVLDRLLADHMVEDYFIKVGSKKGLSREESSKEYHACELPRRFQKFQTPEGWTKKAFDLKWDLVGKIAKGFRILCCSHREDSILMWSHYAEQHRGIVMEFETAEMIEGVDLATEAYEVRYRSSPPSIPALHPDMASFEETLLQVLTTKALEWSYEEEVRIRIPANDRLNSEEPLDLSIDPKCLKRVIVGCYDHPKEKTYAAVERLAEMPSLKHVTFQRAYLDSHDYKLRFADKPSS